ncbi:hypothetical protein CYV26_13980 [Carnobacterium maltaromaticum]|nr:hypothetical protein CYV33_13955 [Carnobacterium maltaromaticum]PLS33164.1 hypothetical protein CYV31_13745 [Carnobacterium maltaromaticum]PLS33250.1 hypothetical protein CYV30_13760 [Carnobacterium maltaromaticum]PLS40970.1 hypothetical protein CYV28_13705 [Carnobacterium maltaromaticum]PLS41730.1 hypothetical protein CYV27_13410 [Carnobacterium maltaromaticum]
MKNMDQKKVFSMLSSIYSTLIILFLVLYFLTKDTNSLLIDICLIGLLVIAIIFAVILFINYRKQKSTK